MNTTTTTTTTLSPSAIYRARVLAEHDSAVGAGVFYSYALGTVSAAELLSEYAGRGNMVHAAEWPSPAEPTASTIEWADPRSARLYDHARAFRQRAVAFWLAGGRLRGSVRPDLYQRMNAVPQKDRAAVQGLEQWIERGGAGNHIL